mmetsp:Transcript_13826/g.32985  ORF Transcript_13826/g.32985 Transcript_13826/m.32985 type:complete len:441 (-) Transcript_13826:294-1616(-)
MSVRGMVSDVPGALPKVPQNLPEDLKETWEKISAFVSDRMKETSDEAQHMLEKAMGEHAIKDIRDPKVVGLALALSSSAFIGASFVLTRMALQRASLKPGVSARAGGFSYVREPLWWLAMSTMLLGELANFSAYAYAPAVLVTPLGAISIITTALLADCILGERLHACGMAGCFFCILGSMVLVSASPQEQMLTSVEEIWAMATQPAFIAYVTCALLIVAVLVCWGAPIYGESQVLVYVCICSLMGSLSVVSCKALGVALKLTFRGSNQLVKPETYAFAASVAVCVAAQLNYLNKALDTFNTAMVSSIYYVIFTVCTITASTIMYKDWKNQTVSSIWYQALGFSVIVFGVYALNVTKEAEPGCRNGLRALFGVGDSWRRPQHELGERSRLLAGEDIADANHRRNAEACEGEDDEEAQPIIAGAPDRRGVADSRRRSQPNY